MQNVSKVCITATDSADHQYPVVSDEVVISAPTFKIPQLRHRLPVYGNNMPSTENTITDRSNYRKNPNLESVFERLTTEPDI